MLILQFLRKLTVLKTVEKKLNLLMIFPKEKIHVNFQIPYLFFNHLFISYYQLNTSHLNTSQLNTCFQ